MTPSDSIMDLYRQGLSYRQIAIRTGRTREAIIGYVWRWKRRGGPPQQLVPRRAVVKCKVPATMFKRVTLDAFNEYGLTERARWVAMYLLSTSLGYGATHAGMAFDAPRTTVALACRRIEEARDDDPDLDEWISEWEQKNSPGY